MRRIKLNLALVAVVLGTTFGVATAGTFRAATLYYNCELGEIQQIPDGFRVECDAEQVNCTYTGTLANPSPTGDHGCGTLKPL